MQTFSHNLSDSFNCDFSSSVYKSSTLSPFPHHFHKNFELIMVSKGECICTLNGRRYLLTAGQAMFVCPFQTHSFSLGEHSEVRRITFHHHLILTVFQSINGKIPKDPVFIISNDLLDLTFKKINSFWGYETVSFPRIAPYETRIQIKGLLYLLCGEFLQTAELIQPNNSGKIAFDMVDYISKNFQKNITLSELARQYGYNSQYVSRVFNNTLGISFKKMLNMFRLEYAFAMLQDTDLPISHICFESGFQSIRSFNQECKNVFGKTPKELRLVRSNALA